MVPRPVSSLIFPKNLIDTVPWQKNSPSHIVEVVSWQRHHLSHVEVESRVPRPTSSTDPLHLPCQGGVVTKGSSHTRRNHYQRSTSHVITTDTPHLTRRLFREKGVLLHHQSRDRFPRPTYHPSTSLKGTPSHIVDVCWVPYNTVDHPQRTTVESKSLLTLLYYVF